MHVLDTSSGNGVSNFSDKVRSNNNFCIRNTTLQKKKKIKKT